MCKQALRPQVQAQLKLQCENIHVQECIPVGCVPSTCYCTREGVSLTDPPSRQRSPLDCPGQRHPLNRDLPWTETPPGHRPPLDRDPLDRNPPGPGPGPGPVEVLSK